MFDYNKLLNLYIPEDFGTETEDDYSGAIEDIEFELQKFNIHTANGATMFVVIDNDPANKKVAKILFNGEYWYDEDTGESTFEPFFYNYANRTIDIYDNAEYAGVNAIFAKCEILGKHSSGRPIFVQDFVITVSEVINNEVDEDVKIPVPSEDSRKKYKEQQSKSVWGFWHRFNDNWLCNAIDYYGFDFVKRFIDFCDDNNITDTHNGNIGYRLDGSPCILDWAGYLE